MEELLLVNPRKRKTPRRNAKGRFVKTIASNPRKRRARRRNPATALAANPKRRRSVSRAAKRVMRRRRRNPAGFGNLGTMLMDGLQGGLGAVAVDAAVGFLPLPATMQTGYMKHAVRVASAVALGAFGPQLIGAAARKMASGAMAVIMRDVVKEVAAGAGINLGGIGYTSPSAVYLPRQPAIVGGPTLNEYVDYGASAGNGMMGEYLQ